MSSSSAQPVTLGVERDVAVIEIDNPPINASTAEVRAGLLDAIRAVATDRVTRAAVLIGHGYTFISGSDLQEFGGPLPAPLLPDVIAAIEECPKPVVAALSGYALGGGFELALACDGRVALVDAVVGLPEVSLGMIPGAGGTQRLPRLVGTAAAIDIICSGRRLTAAEAHRLGIIDHVVDAELRAAAIEIAYALPDKRNLLDLEIPLDSPGASEPIARSALMSGRGRPHIVAAIGAVLNASVLPARVALRREREEFDRLRLGREAAALRRLFFAERSAIRRHRDAAARQVSSVAVVGAGTMGTGITRAVLDAGLPVTLVDTETATLERARAAIRAGYERSIRRGRLDEHAAATRLDRLTAVTSIEAISTCDLVIETVTENEEVKIAVLREVDRVVRPSTLVASNTSYLDLDRLAAAAADPTRVIGLHFFSPAQATPVLEVVRRGSTPAHHVATAVGFARALGKIPIVANVGFGFIGNRIFNAYRARCETMLLEGALPDRVDRVLEDFGFAMGPFRVADMSGLDIAWRMRRARTATAPDNVGSASIADRLCEAGRFGQKTGRGWYAYPDGPADPRPDPAVTELIRAHVADAVDTRPIYSDDDIVRRAVGAMANEALLALEDGVAESGADIDLLMTLGYGFPRHHGGPLYWAQNLSPDDWGRLVTDELPGPAGEPLRRGQLHTLSEAS